ncbi:MAG: division/cell wall cluster transcriptional repressor MraZ [Lewinellaceae bacterium]|nr:division/cell wall cluster transcriptional repressor MraZ [Lewinellaceae bacterium]
MLKLLGEYECKIDDKGRMRLPSGLIGQLGEREAYAFVINRGFEECLMLYPEEVWDRISAQVNQLNQFNKKNREFVRQFHRGATQITMDSSDRILVTKRLLEYAGIERDAVLSAYNDRIEIWSKQRYDELMEEDQSDFADLAEEVLGQLDTGDNPLN